MHVSIFAVSSRLFPCLRMECAPTGGSGLYSVLVGIYSEISVHTSVPQGALYTPRQQTYEALLDIIRLPR